MSVSQCYGLLPLPVEYRLSYNNGSTVIATPYIMFNGLNAKFADIVISRWYMYVGVNKQGELILVFGLFQEVMGC